MTLRSQFSLGHSEFNAFLFATVGEETNGTELTVLSMLSRLGLDPWGEAAKLTDLPRETAVQALIATISALPEGNWKTVDLRAVAASLIGRLPGCKASDAVLPEGIADGGQKKKPMASVWLIFMVLAAGAYMVMSHQQVDHDPEPIPDAVSSPPR